MISRTELTHAETGMSAPSWGDWTTLIAVSERDRTVVEPSNIPDVGRVQDTGYHSVPSRDATALEDDPAREYGDFDLVT